MDKLIIQFALNENTDFDRLIEIEDALTVEFLGDRSVEIDGHDIGQERFNIFIHLMQGWEPALGRVTKTLGKLGMLDQSVVARFHGETATYEVVRPDSYSGRFAL